MIVIIIVCFSMFSHIIGEGYGIFPPTGTCHVCLYKDVVPVK